MALDETGKATLSVLATLTAIFIISVSAFTFVRGFIMKRVDGLDRLVQAYKGVMLVVFTMLIKVQITAHSAEYLNTLQRLLTMRYIDNERAV